jgi:hypothetical protein
MPDPMLKMIARTADALIEAATWVSFTLAGMKYGPSRLEQLKRRRAEERLAAGQTCAPF